MRKIKTSQKKRTSLKGSISLDFKHKNSIGQLNQLISNQMSKRNGRMSSIDQDVMSSTKDPNNDYLDSLTNLQKYSINGEYGICSMKCLRCDQQIECYNEETIGSLIVVCSTIVHYECSLAAPFILDMILTVLKIASKKMYSWQVNSNFYLPGNYSSISKQFLRCVLHQLAGNQIFFQLFQSEFESMSSFLFSRIFNSNHIFTLFLLKGPELLETLSTALNDFNELNSISALKHIIKVIWKIFVF